MITNVCAIEDGTLKLTLSGEINHNNVKSHIDLGSAAIIGNQPKKLVLDFADVTFMDSSCIGFIMYCYKYVRKLIPNGMLSIINTKTPMKKIMRISGLDRIATIE